MLKTYLKIAFRQLWRNKFYSGLNILGLGVGLTASMILFLIVDYERSYDKFHAQSEHIYKVAEKRKGGNITEMTKPTLIPELLKDYPEIAGGTRWLNWADNFKYQDEYFNQSFHFVDSGFVDVFTLKTLYGNPEIALREHGQVVVTRKCAQKIFGRANVVSEELVLHREDSPNQIFEIGAVVEDYPKNSTLQFQMLVPILNVPEDFKGAFNWYNTFMNSFIRLKENANKETFLDKIQVIVKDHFLPQGNEEEITLIPLENLHAFLTKNKSILSGLTGIAVLILLITGINYINLSGATSLTRVKENEIKRFVGAGNRHIFFQFLWESVLISFFATLLAFILSISLVPRVNQYFDLGIVDDWQHFGYLALFAFPAGILIGVVSGIFPARNILKWVIPGFQKAKSRALLKPKGQQPLLIFQFAFTILLIVASLVIWLQINHLKSQDLNFNKDHLIGVYFAPENFPDLPDPITRLQTVRMQLSAYSTIEGITMTQTLPGDYNHDYNTFTARNNPAEKINLRKVTISHDYFRTLGIDYTHQPVINLETIGKDDKYVIINQNAFEALGWKNIEGKYLCSGGTEKGCNDPYQVIGVVENYHYQSLKNKMQPVIHFVKNGENLVYFNQWLIRLQANKIREGLDTIRNAYNDLGPVRPFEYQFIDEVYDQMYKQQERLGTTAGAFSLVAVILAGFGMLSIASFTVKRRTKEIAIRKVNGARKGQIVALFSKNFLISVGVAFVIACPLAWYIMHDWLQDFAYRIQIDWWVFGIAGLIAVLITLGTVGVQTFRAALANPVDSLQDE